MKVEELSSLFRARLTGDRSTLMGVRGLLVLECSAGGGGCGGGVEEWSSIFPGSSGVRVFSVNKFEEQVAGGEQEVALQFDVSFMFYSFTP